VTVLVANREVRAKKPSPQPRPGSEVFVPVKDTTRRTNYVALSRAIRADPREDGGDHSVGGQAVGVLDRIHSRVHARGGEVTRWAFETG